MINIKDWFISRKRLTAEVQVLKIANTAKDQLISYLELYRTAPSNLRLFAWKPRGHGEQSLFVMAENEERARLAICSKIATVSKEYGLDFSGWETDYYELTVAGIEEVILNNND